MGAAPPVIYVLHGDDEFAIAQFLAEMESRLGDPATAAMNTTRLDGRMANLDDLASVTSAMPFLSNRRLVVLTNPLARLKDSAAQKKFLDHLEKIPPTTALVLVEYKPLTEEREKKKGEFHWLEGWAEARPDRVYLKLFQLPKGVRLGRWIQEQAKKAGGQFTQPAADLLASLVAGDTRLADQEIHKLLAYVNYQRPVEPEDVESLTADAAQGDIFVLVDALGNQDGRRALGMLHRLLERQEAISIFGMIVRQFRLLLLAREVLDNGGGREAVARQLRVAPFVADKLVAQAQRFTLADLEAAYHRLLDLDLAVKTSQIPDVLALDTLVTAFTAAKTRSPVPH